MRGITQVDIRTEPGDCIMYDHHNHKECEVCYIMQGKRGVYIKDRLITMETGSLLFINSRVLHRAVPVSEEPHVYFVFCFQPQLLLRWQRIVPEINFSSLFDRSYMLVEPNLLDHQFVQI